MGSAHSSNLLEKALYRVFPPGHLLFFAQRAIKNPQSRDTISRMVATLLPKPRDNVELMGEPRQWAEKYHDKGFVVLRDFLDYRMVEEIRNYLADKPVFDRFRPELGTFQLKDAPAESHVANYRTEDIIACPHVTRIANDSSILKVAANVLGCRPTISTIAIWWTLPGEDKPEDAELFHRDVDDWRFMKLFVYLTHVDEDSGPHEFVRGSHRDSRLLKIRRYQDREIEAAFGRDRMEKFEGPAGMSFIENTFGFHKGPRPTKKPRLCLQVQYSMLPIYIEKYRPLPAPVGFSFDAYTNRLFLKA